MPEVAGSFYSRPTPTIDASVRITPRIPLMHLAEQSGMTPAEVARSLDQLIEKGYLRPLSADKDGAAIAWAVNLKPKAGDA